MGRAWKWLFGVGVGVALLQGTAWAQPLDVDCEPETGALGALADDVDAAAKAPPSAKAFAESVMATILADKEDGKKDRWGYTSHTGDGCFARSYATNYDIAKGVFGKMPEGLTHKTVYIYWKNMNWWYHTAAVVSGPDGDYVLDGLNGKVQTVAEWEEYWKKGEHFDKLELKDGMFMHPGETHDGKPNLDRRLEAQRWINDRKKLVPVPTYPYEPPVEEDTTRAERPEGVPR